MKTGIHKEERARTSALCLAYACPYLAGANHPETLSLVERAHLLLSLAERHAVLQFAELGLRVRLLRLSRTVGRFVTIPRR